MMPLADGLDWEALAAYFAGESPVEETAAIERWIAGDPERRDEIERLREAWRQAGETPPAAGIDTEAGWNRMAARVRAQRNSPVQGTPRPVLAQIERPRRLGWNVAIRVAAAIAVVAAGGLVWRQAAGGLGKSAETLAAAREIVTRPGERASLTLSDGTKVVLGAASKLIVPAGYGRSEGAGKAGSRVVRLEGEGYFDVTHDAARPFAVEAGHGVVRDIGTKFVVRAYESGRPIEVAVAEGEVLLDDAHLRQGDWGQLDTTGTVRVRRGIDLRPYVSWTDGRLVFDDTPLREAIPTLERWYDLDIRVADSALYDRRLFATLTNEPADKVLDLVALSLRVRATREGRTVTLHR